MYENSNDFHFEDSISLLLTSTQLAEESNSLTDLPIRTFCPFLYTHDFLYVVPRVSVSRRTLQYRVRHFTPTYDMTNELRLSFSLALCTKRRSSCKRIRNICPFSILP